MLPGCTPWPPEYAARYRAAGHWTGQTLHGMLRARAVAHPDRVAVVSGDRRWTYAELDARAIWLAAAWHRRGLRAGDRVVVQLPNTAEFLEVIFALFRLGALPVYALPSHRHSEITHFCTATGAVGYVTTGRHAGFDHRLLAAHAVQHCPRLRHVVIAGTGDDAAPGGAPGAGPGSAPEELPFGAVSLDALRAEGREAGAAALAEVPEPDPADIAFLQLSGGSTGLPKFIPRTHDDYLYSVRASAEICGLGPDTVLMCVLPMAHNFPMSSPGFLGALHAGGRVVLAPRATPAEAFALIAAERVTITSLVPPLALLWLDAAEAARAQGAPDALPDLGSLRVLQVGGAKFSEQAARRVRPVLGCDLQQVFGMAEGLVNYTRLDDPEEVRCTTQGRPISPDDEVRVVDDEDRDVPDGTPGHLLTRGPYTIRGYYSPDGAADAHNAAAFTPDGYYRTGDVVRRTPDGYLVVEGRAKDQINRGGEKIAAEEVENHLLAHPDVHDAAVVAMPDDYLGERTCAFVVPRAPRDQAPSGIALKAFLRGRGLADYKIPDRVEITEAFPRTHVGKVSKRELRQALRAQLLARADSAAS
ncbi:(2,3-dihydroxybenzoyl)adenylate synthase [Allostreptomyces psammosilenae]|uniref:2,3-dihydroxybenzoate-AMP ligase n=1 Tax=Allostreptomyces psammosilenae TaxID=1892865 RepID=A0A853A0V3_9ACTN|nr:AMP-binding protein [Allostreptomyces psammosilenae]NYI08243.1 2,3-dihydroxybenzoate-AMP ligase [Allostreptomyces psammosilenae]